MLSKNGKDMHLTVWFSSKYVNLASSSLTQHKLSNVNIGHFCIEQAREKENYLIYVVKFLSKNDMSNAKIKNFTVSIYRNKRIIIKSFVAILWLYYMRMRCYSS